MSCLKSRVAFLVVVGKPCMYKGSVQEISQTDRMRNHSLGPQLRPTFRSESNDCPKLAAMPSLPSLPKPSLRSQLMVAAAGS